MKTNKLFLLAALLVTAPAFGFAAERVVDVSELPPPVKKVLDDTGQRESVQKITVRHAGGRLVYDVAFGRKDESADHLRVSEDGTVLNDTRKAAAQTPVVAPLGFPAAGYGYEPNLVPTPPSVRLEDLPKAVQETLRREADGRPIAAIHGDTLDGRKGYVAEFRESGRNPRVFVAEDGNVLRPTEKLPALLIGTTFSDTPAPVQQSIRREIGEGEIVGIDKDKEGRGETETYQVEVKDARGAYRLRIASDGRVLENTRRASR